jgi:thioredoxin-dependent peroxiredoxin
VILGASFDSGAANASFAKKFNFNFPLLTAPKSMAIAYGAAKDESARSATRVGVIIGADGKVKEWHPKVTAATFPAEALERI